MFHLLMHTPLGSFGQIGKQLSKAGSFGVSVISSYILNRRWTFRSVDPNILRQPMTFFAVASIGLVINNGIFFVASSPRYLGLTTFWSLVTAAGVVSCWNFIINKYWTFRKVVPESKVLS